MANRPPVATASGSAPVGDPAVADVLVVEGLTKRFGDRTVVDGVALRIARGETYGLLGPNGAGKTTTISMVCGLIAPDAGSVVVAGRPMTPDTVEVKAAIGFVPQDIALYPDLTARENLTFFGRLQGMPKDRLRARIAEVLDIIGLTDRADERIESYSGGMKRRCNIGAGLLHEPQLLILDEPTVGVDPQSRNAILESIEVLGGRGLSVLYTTHYMEEAERLCDRIGIIDEGRLIAEGTRRELIDQLGEHTHIKVEVSGAVDALATACRGIEQVVAVNATATMLDVMVRDGSRALAPIVDAAEHTGAAVSSVEVVEPDLETVFLHLTGKALRD